MRETRPFIIRGSRRPLLTLVSTGRVEQRTEMMLQLMGEFLGGESGVNIFLEVL